MKKFLSKLFYTLSWKMVSIFIHDCLECQRNYNFNMKIQTAAKQFFQNMLLPSITESLWIQKDPIILISQHKYYTRVIIDAFSHFIVTVPIKLNTAKTAVKTLFFIGLQNLAHQFTFLLIEDQNT